MVMVAAARMALITAMAATVETAAQVVTAVKAAQEDPVMQQVCIIAREVRLL